MTNDEINDPPGRVVIFGAGVTGLTVAHELIVRGFDVCVVEKHSIRDGTPDCAVGGMAATQYVYDLHGDGRPETYAQLRAPALDISGRLIFKKDSATELDGSQAELDGMKSNIDAWKESHRHQILRIQLHGYAGWGRVERAFERARHIAVKLGLLVPKDGGEGPELLEQPDGRIRVELLAHTCPEPRVDGAGKPYEGISWRRVEPRFASPVPGEHGYRYFPGYYRNLFDTMRRTPIYDDRGVETAHTVFENLVPTKRTAFSDPDNRLTVLERRPLRSIEELRRQLEMMLGQLHFTWQDIVRIQLKILRYLTSCKKRRVSYESISWWDFIEGHELSAEAQDHMLSTPQALVAMSAQHSDARVQGNTLVQLLMGQWSAEERADLSLNGPTTEAWLDHWRRFLEYQGVRFYQGELEFFAEDSEGVIPVVTSKDQTVLDCKKHARVRIFDEDPPLSREEQAALGHIEDSRWPCWISKREGWVPHVKECEYVPTISDAIIASLVRKGLVSFTNGKNRCCLVDPEHEHEHAHTMNWREQYENERKGLVSYHARDTFFVLATDVQSAQRAVRCLDPRSVRPQGSVEGKSSVEMLQDYRLNRPDQLPKITDPLRFFAGIQYYFDRRLDFFEGHIFYKKSFWGLTSISQAQFWRRRRVRQRDRYLTVLSVILGKFDVEGLNGKTAWDCTRDEIAVEVWKQIEQSLAWTAKSPSPSAYHIDDNLIFNRRDRLSFRVRERRTNCGGEDEWIDSNTGTITITGLDGDPTPEIPSQGRQLRMVVDGKARFDVGGGSIGFPYPFHGNGQISPKEADSKSVIAYQPNAGFAGFDFFGSQGVHTVEVRHEDGPVVRDGALRLHLEGFLELDLTKYVEHRGTHSADDIRYQIVTQPTQGGLYDPPPEMRYRPNRRMLGGDRIGHNLTPFHTNPVDDWKRRPGWLPERSERDGDASTWPPTIEFRRNLHKNLVLAGTYTKTYTRLTTMEAANESGRHAVNTILAELSIRNDNHEVAEPCKTWDPEEHEVDDLASLKLLDEALLDAGLPHFADILQLDRLPDMIVDRRHDDLSLRPNTELLGRLLKYRSAWPAELSKLWESVAGSATKPMDLLAELGKHGMDASAFGSAFEPLLDWLGTLGKGEGTE